MAPLLRRRLGWAVLLGAIAFASGAGAGSLDRMADALAARARPALGRSEDACVWVAAPWPRLAADLGELVATRLRSGGAHDTVRAPSGEVGWAQKHGCTRLLRVEVDAAAGTLRASGMVIAVPSALWRDEPEARAHLYAEATLDAELRAYLPPGPQAQPGAWQARGLPVGDVDVRALDVGDTDGDGRAEIVAATPEELVAWTFSADSARLVEKWRARLDARPAKIRPRADVVTVSVADGAVLARASAFEAGIRRAGHGAAPLAPGFQAWRGFHFPGLSWTCELEPGVDWFTPASCGLLPTDAPERFWIAAGLRQGTGPAPVAAVIPGGAGGVLWLRVGGAAQLVPGVGAQVALARLDRGDVVVTSDPVEKGEPDALTVRALAPGAPVLHRVERLPGGVKAIAAGDLDGDGKVEILAAVREGKKTEIWVLR